jgi:hypothetical protein
MMETFLFAVLYAAIAVCVVVYFLVFFNRPAALHRMLGNGLRYNLKSRRSNRYDGRLSLSVRLLIYAWLAAVFLGLAFCIHRGRGEIALLGGRSRRALGSRAHGRYGLCGFRSGRHGRNGPRVCGSGRSRLARSKSSRASLTRNSRNPLCEELHAVDSPAQRSA